MTTTELNDSIEPKSGSPPKGAKPEAAVIPEGFVKVRVRGPTPTLAGGMRPGGAGKIFTGETNENSKTDPFPTYPAGAEIWLSPETADAYDRYGWVSPVDDKAAQ